MKKIYRFSSGDIIEANTEDLRALRDQYEQYMQNYQEVLGCLDDGDYVARGNGFCDAKYSEDFVEGQIEKYRQRMYEIDNWLAQKL